MLAAALVAVAAARAAADEARAATDIFIAKLADVDCFAAHPRLDGASRKVQSAAARIANFGVPPDARFDADCCRTLVSIVRWLPVLELTATVIVFVVLKWQQPRRLFLSYLVSQAYHGEAIGPLVIERALQHAAERYEKRDTDRNQGVTGSFHGPKMVVKWFGGTSGINFLFDVSGAVGLAIRDMVLRARSEIPLAEGRELLRRLIDSLQATKASHVVDSSGRKMNYFGAYNSRWLPSRLALALDIRISNESLADWYDASFTFGVLVDPANRSGKLALHGDVALLEGECSPRELLDLAGRPGLTILHACMAFCVTAAPPAQRSPKRRRP